MKGKKLTLNTTTAVIKEIVALICGFILPRYIIKSYGSEVNGLLASITQFLGFISFLEMGIGPVIQSNLYKPLAEKNSDEISRIISSAEKFFRKIAYIFLLYIVILLFVYPELNHSGFDRFFSGSLIVIIGISTFAQYFFGITYQLLLNADQKNYIQLILQTATILLNTIVSVLLIKIGFSIHVVKLASSLIFVIRPLAQVAYVNNHYNINHSIKYEDEPIKQKWNGFAQHFAAVITENTDVVLLTLFSSMTNVSIYAVYHTIVYGITTMVLTLATGLESLWGNMLARKEYEKIDKSFEVVEWAFHGICTLLFSITFVLIVPFIKIYTSGFEDANYIQPIFGALLVLAYMIYCLRIPYFRIIKAVCHYKQTQAAAFVQSIINIIISLLLIKKFGLIGVAIGTLCAMLFHTVYFAIYLSNNILKRSFFKFVKNCVVDIAAFMISVYISTKFDMNASTYYGWALIAIRTTVLHFVIISMVNCTLYFQIVKETIQTIKNFRRISR